jgi:hypothetical protein
MLIAGAITIETSQKGGRPFIGGNACGRVSVGTKPAGSGGWNVPPGNDFAVIEATSGSTRLPKLSQVLAADEFGTAATAANKIAEYDSILNGLTIDLPPFNLARSFEFRIFLRPFCGARLFSTPAGAAKGTCRYKRT